MNAGSYLTMGEAARELGLTKARISQLGNTGDLDVRLVDGRKQVLESSVRAYAARKSSVGRPSRLATADVYTLMSAEYEVARVAYDARFEYPFELLEVLDKSRMPLGVTVGSQRDRKRGFNAWWEHRSIPDTRPGLSAKLSQMSLSASYELPVRSLGLSLSDCYWLRPDGHDDFSWDELNYFDNPFLGGDDKPATDSWLARVGMSSPDNTSEGELPKRWVIREGKRVLIKGCGFDDQRPFNEVVATILFSRLLNEGDFVPYAVEAFDGSPVCTCANFLNGREEYIPAAYVRETEGRTRGSSVFDRFCKHAGRMCADEPLVRTYLSKMIVCDYILANSDRHWRNFGFIRNIDTLEMRPAPLFDTGNCLWYSTPLTALAIGDRGYASRPFEVDPVRQLGLVDNTSWFDPTALDGFVEDAIEILAGSEHAAAGGRLDLLAHALECQVDEAIFAVRVVSGRN